MKRNMFGEAQPANYAEMVEAMEIKDKVGEDVYAEVFFSDDSGEPFDGWSTEVRENESGDQVFSSLGYADKDALLADLKAIGVRNIEFSAE